MLNDAHCHFFSTAFFTALARQRGPKTSAQDLYRELQWDDPGTPETLADRWVQELDANDVGRAALIASVPGDEASVATAIARHPSRLVGFFMLDPSAIDAVERTRRALSEQRLRALCLFPAMHGVPLHDARTLRVVEAAAAIPGAAVFVHCGVLSVGVRRKLGLPSRFDIRFGDPLGVVPARPGVPADHLRRATFRCRIAARSAYGGRHLRKYSFGHVELEQLDSLYPGADARPRLQDRTRRRRPSRLLFGTDSSFFPRGWQKATYQQQKAVLDGLGIKPEDEALILGGNFDRLFPRAT